MTQPPSLSDRLRRGDVLAAACPSREVLRHVTGRWAVLILIVLEEGTQRFSALRRRVDGVSERMLAQTLKHLEHDGLVARVSHAVVPPHVDYTLTPLGEEAAAHVRRLADWVEANVPQIVAARG
ncbi:helix-turn-helix transcriptional regulator [Sphingomonas sp. RP10(2022)]|uniref:Helix-turn-helix transcriptional regulator n=1 Tax=Sphingomonas liriopis TaxID=2949094 RepID=A0A9X2HZX0_9SPHN|nr:helix-turn-helix domain-containing protein [Sphingomonas liriopis]MCP3735950.1 helix-turn-helix transcriptional regulator [Sphingomonas liriopis]